MKSVRRVCNGTEQRPPVACTEYNYTYHNIAMQCGPCSHEHGSLTAFGQAYLLRTVFAGSLRPTNQDLHG